MPRRKFPFDTIGLRPNNNMDLKQFVPDTGRDVRQQLHARRANLLLAVTPFPRRR